MCLYFLSFSSVFVFLFLFFCVKLTFLQSTRFASIGKVFFLVPERRYFVKGNAEVETANGDSVHYDQKKSTELSRHCSQLALEHGQETPSLTLGAFGFEELQSPQNDSVIGSDVRIPPNERTREVFLGDNRFIVVNGNNCELDLHHTVTVEPRVTATEVLLETKFALVDQSDSPAHRTVIHFELLEVPVFLQQGTAEFS